MHNYYNIIPFALLNILIIFFFVGLSFLVIAVPLIEELVSKQLIASGIETNQQINQLDEYKTLIPIEQVNKIFQPIQSIELFQPIQPNQSLPLTISFKEILLNYMKPIFTQAMNDEKKILDKKKTEYILIFVFTTFGLSLCLIAYVLYLKYKIKVFNVDWKNILISVGCFILSIILVLLIYMFTIIPNKKTNTKKAELITLNIFNNISSLEDLETL